MAGDEKTVRLLLKSGAARGPLNRRGLTPVDLAEANGFSVVATLLTSPPEKGTQPLPEGLK